jgi:hypothetical protein
VLVRNRSQCCPTVHGTSYDHPLFPFGMIRQWMKGHAIWLLDSEAPHPTPGWQPALEGRADEESGTATVAVAQGRSRYCRPAMARKGYGFRLPAMSRGDVPCIDVRAVPALGLVDPPAMERARG